MAKRKSTAKAAADEPENGGGAGPDESGPAATGDRKQMTAEGEEAGIPVEEMSQTQRQAMGQKLAEGGTFAEAYEETKPAPDSEPQPVDDATPEDKG